MIKIAYFINQYPKVSHTFIKREILALEKQGVSVQRIALRGWEDLSIASTEGLELAKTQYVLQLGNLRLMLTAIKQLTQQPKLFFKAFCLATKMSLGSDRLLPYHWMYLLEACQVAQWLKESGAQHIHAHFGTNSTEVVMLAHILGAPQYSFTVHGPEEFDKPQLIKLAEKVARASFVVAISSFGRSQLYRWISYQDWQKVKVVHCGLEPTFFADAAVALPETKRLVCVGRLCEQKGQLLLVQAMKQFIDKGLAFELVLAGDGEMRAEIEQLIAHYHLNAYIKITGWISSDAVRQEIQAAQALVLPSFAEGLPVVIMEAMSLYRPVLSTYIAGIPELITNNVEGLLFEAGSVDAITQAISHFFALSLDEKMAMGQRAHERVLIRHDIDTEAKKLLLHFDVAIKAHALLSDKSIDAHHNHGQIS